MKKILLVIDFKKRENRFINHVADLFEKEMMEYEADTKRCVLKTEADLALIGQEVEDWKPQIICTFDMAGFEQLTLTETYYYNICTAKQMHVIVNDNSFADYRDGEYAMNLYMCIPRGCKYAETMRERILNVWEYPAFRGIDSDGDIAKTLVQRFMNEIGNYI